MSNHDRQCLVWFPHVATGYVTGVKIDETSPEHPYLQLAGFLRAQIVSGEITHQLPSITELTEETELAVGTVRRAINILVKEGLVETVPGRGTFVIEPRPPRSRAAAGRDVPVRPHGHVSH
jgi:GntR family transcriptional regulator